MTDILWNDDPGGAHEDRRRHPRITFKAYGLSYICALLVDGTVHEAVIVDISAGGARLRPLGGWAAPARGQALEVDTRFPGVAVADARRRGIVRWQTGQEFGVAFDSELPYGVADLQCLLDGGAVQAPSAGCHPDPKGL